MATRRHSLPDPETLGRPDVGFVAAVGVYVAAVLVGSSVSIALAVGGTASTILGSVSSAVTIGILLGAVVADRIEGLPERLGRSRRTVALPFLAPATFVLASVAALAVPSIPRTAALGTALGAVLTVLAAGVVASMSLTRYTRAVTPDEPVAAFSWQKTNGGRYWIAIGVVCLASVGAIGVVTGDLVQPGFVWLFVYGLFALYVGFVQRRSADGRERRNDGDVDTGWNPRRRILGSEWVQPFDPTPSIEMLPELRVHEAGIVLKRPLQRRLVPWADVRDVRLSDEALVFERDGWFDVRCDRSVIDDPEGVYEAIQRARADGSATGG